MLADQAARERIRGDLKSTLVVEAAAGTGKTTELVARLVALVRTGTARLDRILAVTFTDKAAGELKLRLRGELEVAREKAAGTEKQFLAASLQHLEVAAIGTIHSLCSDLLREFPLEAGIDPQFEVAAGEGESRLFDAAFDSWFPRAVADRLEGVRRILRKRARGFGDGGPREDLRRAGRELIQRRDFPAPWKRPFFDRSKMMEAALAAVRSAAELFPKAKRKDDWIAKSLHDLHRFLVDLDRREQQGGRDEDGLEAELRELISGRHRHWNWSGGARWFADGIEKQQAIAVRDAARVALEAFSLASEADLAALLREELRPLVDEYEARKAKAGSLDFLDLLLRARDLIRDQPRVRHELQERFTHLLVDEFQDTDPVQAELLFLLAADDPGETIGKRSRPIAGKLFVVGDPKQSIYRFRRADIALYESAKEQLLAAGASLVHLTVSFRAVPDLQLAINAAFAPQMIAGPLKSQAAYVALDRARDGSQSRPALIALPAPRIYDPGRGSKPSNKIVDQSYADAVGAFVDWLTHESGWTIPEKQNGKDVEVQIEPRHICLLFKRFASFGRDLTAPYAKAFEARGLEHVLVGGRSFHSRPELLALRNALAAIEWPDDELHVYASLRGPLFALTDDQLLAWRGQFQRLSPTRPFDEDSLAKLSPSLREVAEALAILKRLNRARNKQPIAETIADFLSAVRAHAGVAMGNAGEQALANLLRAQELARRFEQAGATSFRAFVQRLARDAESGETAEAAVYEEGAEGVRLMTVHKAKGLEFPVVILCDPTAPLAQGRPSRLLDGDKGLFAAPLAGMCPAELNEHKEELLQRDRDEAVRLLYVAATRARDLLVAPILGEGELDSWLKPLADVLHPIREEERTPKPSPGCPPFGRDSLLVRSDDADPRSLSISPGLHRPRAGTHALTVWDPRALKLDAEPEGGIRREGLLMDLGAESQGAVVARAHEEWRCALAAAREMGSVPLFEVRTVTAAAKAIAEEAGALSHGSVAIERVELRDPKRPGGARFGTLVHAILALSDLNASEKDRASQADALARSTARSLGAEELEILHAARAATLAMQHPLMRRAAQSRDCRREVELLRSESAQPRPAILEGVADLVFREEGEAGPRWIVVDFKTDLLPEAEPKYAAQLRLYAGAVEAASGEPAIPVLFAV
jgi:ATP-dependent helicase/nuclease subunit A